MRNHLGLALLGCLTFAHLSPGQSLEGTWRQTTPNVGQSDWLLADQGDGTYKAREFGLGNAQGIGRFKNGTLTIDWKYSGGSGVSEWKLKEDTGTGALFEPRIDDKAHGTAVPRMRGGEKVWAFENSNQTGNATWFELSIIPFVLAVFRYALLLEQGGGGAPEDLVLSDPTLLVLGALWAIVFGVAVYLS